jgi:trimethylamine--corrinoid protein Co-methyltransferase
LDTDSKMLDEQAGIERAMAGLLPALAGADSLSGGGCLEGGITTSYEQLVIDNEIYAMIFRAAKGISVNEETLAVDIIAKVLRESSNFLEQKHTLSHFRTEHFMPTLASREARARWEKTGSKSLAETAREEVKKTLAEHQPLPLDQDLNREIEKILKTATKALAS